jgi:hypothetical protein
MPCQRLAVKDAEGAAQRSKILDGEGHGHTLRRAARLQHGALGPYFHSWKDNAPMNTDQPSRVTPAEISDLLRVARLLPPNAPLGEQIAYFERKADLLSRIAADTNTADARAAAAEAWDQVAALAAQLRQKVQDDIEAP